MSVIADASPRSEGAYETLSDKEYQLLETLGMKVWELRQRNVGFPAKSPKSEVRVRFACATIAELPYIALLEGLSMKSLLRFCLFVIVPLVWLGASVNTIHAQQSVSVSPEVKADVIRRLEVAKTWIMPRGAQIVRKVGNGGVEKDLRRVCNEGPTKTSDSGTQEDSCASYLIYSGIWGLTSGSLDVLMPAFKFCSMTTNPNVCGHLVDVLINTGHIEEALAVGEYAPTCKGCVGFDELLSTQQGYSLVIKSSKSNTVTVTSPLDVIQLLRKSCEEGGIARSCTFYQQVGGSYSEAERERARAEVVAARTADNKDGARRQDRANAASAASQANLNAMLGAVSAATPNIQETAAQQQANLQALAIANQQRQQAEAQARAAATQNTRPTPSGSTASINPYAGTGSESTGVSSCTNVNGSVQLRVTHPTGAGHCGGELVGSFTNSSSRSVDCAYVFHKSGAWSTGDQGGVTLSPGETKGGELSGIWACSTDSNEMRYMCYQHGATDAHGMSCTSSVKF